MSEALWSPGSPSPPYPLDMPVLASRRLRVRALRPDDLPACHALWREIGYADPTLADGENLQRRKAWLDWTIASYGQLAALAQPPYGDRAIEAGDGGRFLGLIGLVPAMGPFDQLRHDAPARFTAEVGLFWAVRAAEQGRGIASEAAGLMVAYAFEVLKLKRIVATTERANLASQGVMRRLGMRLQENRLGEPAWFQIVGALDA